MRQNVICDLVKDKHLLCQKSSTSDAFCAISQVLPFQFTSHYFYMLWPRILIREQGRKETKHNEDKESTGLATTNIDIGVGATRIGRKDIKSIANLQTNPDPDIDLLLKASSACDILSQYDSACVRKEEDGHESQQCAFRMEEIASICASNDSLLPTFQEGSHLLDADDTTSGSPRLFHMLPDWVHECYSTNSDISDSSISPLYNREYWTELELIRDSVHKCMERYRIEQPFSRTIRPWLAVLSSVRNFLSFETIRFSNFHVSNSSFATEILFAPNFSKIFRPKYNEFKITIMDVAEANVAR